MKKVLSFVFLFVAILLFAKLSFAQTSTSSASAVRLTFPITELGNCSSAADCKKYCDDPTHVDACVSYAKEKGFYKENPLDTDTGAILGDAKITLGCDSLSSCRAFCQQAQNADKCSAFAQKHNLRGGQQNVNTTTLQKAEQILGCNSEDSCKTFCEQDTNKQKCTNFAKSQGLRGGDETVGPGGCASEDSCKTFCSNPNNFQACQQFIADKEGSESAKQFTGPGGCSSEVSCRSFCDKNPSACHLNPEGHESEMSATAAAKLQELQDCREHPELCQKSGSNSGTIQSQLRSEVEKGSFKLNQQISPTEQSEGGRQPLSSPNIQQPSTETPGGGESGSGGGGLRNPFPTSTQSVEAAATHRDFLSWFMDVFLHMH